MGVCAVVRGTGRAVIAAAMLAAMAGGHALLAQTAPTASAQAAPAAAAFSTTQGGTIRGTVKAGATPLPGVAVTATSSVTGKKYATTTDIDGVYQMQVPENATYTVTTELTGFASTTQQVVVNGVGAASPAQTAEFKMDLASRAAPQAPTQQAATVPTAGPRGTAAGGAATPGRPSAPGTTAGGQGRAGANRGTVARVGRGTQALDVQNNSDSRHARCDRRCGELRRATAVAWRPVIQ